MIQLRLQSDSRLNVLLTRDRPHAPEHWTTQLPQLLEPQGVTAYVASTVEEAYGVATAHTIHAAVIDLACPRGCAKSRAATDHAIGAIELFRRLPHSPPLVVLHASTSQRQVDRIMRESLRLGVFCVLKKPVDLHQLLEVFRRLVDRQYRGAWPPATPRINKPNQPNNQ